MHLRIKLTDTPGVWTYSPPGTRMLNNGYPLLGIHPIIFRYPLFLSAPNSILIPQGLSYSGLDERPPPDVWRMVDYTSIDRDESALFYSNLRAVKFGKESFKWCIFLKVPH